eukprot:gene3107-3885_t
MSRYGKDINPLEHQLSLIEEKEQIKKKEREERNQLLRKGKRTIPKNRDITPIDFNQDTSFTAPEFNEDRKLLKVALIGAPNAGKSTIVNSIVGEKVCAVSSREHTTREPILGIYTNEDTQIIFHDTPGIIKNFNRASHMKDFVHTAWSVAKESDIVLLVVDATNNNAPDTETIVNELENQMLELLKELKSEDEAMDKDFVLILNKVDLVKSREGLLDLISKLNESNIFSDTFVISATNKIKIDSLIQYLLDKSYPSPWEFESNMKTDQTDVFRASEIIKEQIYEHLRQEMPYKVVQKTYGWTELPNGDLRIDHDLYVTKKSYKSSLLGAEGKTIKKIYWESRMQLEKIFNRKVHLFIDVKLKKSLDHLDFNQDDGHQH